MHPPCTIFPSILCFRAKFFHPPLKEGEGEKYGDIKQEAAKKKVKTEKDLSFKAQLKLNGKLLETFLTHYTLFYFKFKRQYCARATF